MTRLVEPLYRMRGLARVSDVAGDAYGKLVKPGAIKDAISGTWIGHPLHPILTDVTITLWTGAAVLDLMGEDAERAADRFVTMGLLSALPTAVAGVNEIADTVEPEARRLGGAHAVVNSVASVLYALSAARRRQGKRRQGVLLGMAGATVLLAGGWLGGHLAYRRGVGVNQTAFEERPEDWTEVARADDLTDGRPLCARAGELAVLVVREEGRLFAIADRCSHRGAPLHEGNVSAGTVTCPWHGSTFRLEDGRIERGPAIAPQPAFDVREVAGRIEVRRRRDPSERVTLPDVQEQRA